MVLRVPLWSHDEPQAPASLNGADDQAAIFSVCVKRD